MTTRTVYVELLGEGVDVWRRAIEDGEAFVLPPTSQGERWRFRPGSRIRWRAIGRASTRRHLSRQLAAKNLEQPSDA